jgi:DNA repair ATPase RecN
VEPPNAKVLQEPNHTQAVQHLTEAHKILSKVRQEAGKHPAMDEAVQEAIQRLEMALAILSVKTGGMF